MLFLDLEDLDEVVVAVVAVVAVEDVEGVVRLVDKLGDKLVVRLAVSLVGSSVDSLEAGDSLALVASPVKLTAAVSISSHTVTRPYMLSAWTVETVTMPATTDTGVSSAETLTGSAPSVWPRRTRTSLCLTQSQSLDMDSLSRPAQDQLFSQLHSPPTWTHGQCLTQ